MMSKEFSLSGKKIILTRSQDQLSESHTLFEKKGAEVYDLPSLIIGPPADWGPVDDALGKIDIFDFAMERVIQLNDYKIINENETEIIWNGRNEYGDKVSNGIYFCRLSIDNNYFWTKLAIIKSN